MKASRWRFRVKSHAVVRIRKSAHAPGCGLPTATNRRAVESHASLAVGDRLRHLQVLSHLLRENRQLSAQRAHLARRHAVATLAATHAANEAVACIARLERERLATSLRLVEKQLEHNRDAAQTALLSDAPTSFELPRPMSHAS